MRRRLRKKKRVGEFMELGFAVTATLRSGLSHDDVDAFADRWIDAVELRRLAYGGACGGDGTLDGFVTLMGRGSATEADRRALMACLDADDAVVRHDVGALRDAWTAWGHRSASTPTT
jgi:uncharacterized protein YggL (DUF469 family)